MIRVLLLVVGLAGLLLVWAICGPILLSGLVEPSSTVGMSGDPILHEYYIGFNPGGPTILIHMTPWTKTIAAAVSVIYSIVFVMFTASLFRRQH